MALTASEQLKLMSGEVKPPSNDLLTLVQQSATIESKDFYDDYKEFDPVTYPLAQTYLQKRYSVANQVFKENINTIKSLNRIIVVLIGDSVYTLAQVEAADDSQWENFIVDNMARASELLGAVKKDEKAEYDSL